MMEWYIAVLKNYVGFKGRARRKEYWTFTLINVIISAILGGIGNLLGTTMIAGIYSLAILLPSLAVGVRRLHDVGKSGIHIVILYVLAVVTGIVGSIGTAAAIVGGSSALLIITGILGIAVLVYSIIMLVWFCKEGDAAANQYGENPKQQIAA